MSDGITQSRRDERMAGLVRRIVVKWYSGESYESEVKELNGIGDGFWWPCGNVVARDLSKAFVSGDRKKVVAHYLDCEENQVDALVERLR